MILRPNTLNMVVAGFLLLCLLLILQQVPQAGCFVLNGRRPITATTGPTGGNGRLLLKVVGSSPATVLWGSSNNNNNEKDGTIGIGIDLGTTYSAVAYLKEDNIPSIIPVPHNGRTMPSVVSLGSKNADESKEETGDLSDHVAGWWVGQEACDREVEHGAYRNVKRVLGTGGKLAPDTAQVVPFLVPSSTGKTFKKDNLQNQIHDAEEHPTLLQSCLNPAERISPQHVSAEILKRLVQVAQDATHKTVTRAVIGVPAYFHDAQRAATQQAAQLAGIPKVKLLREPEAAALAYGIGKQQLTGGGSSSPLDDPEELVLVFDLGGGTFDVSILLVGGGLTEIVCTSGNAQLGGSDFDARVAEYCVKLLRQVGGISSIKNWSDEANSAVVRAAEQIRIYLSNNKRVNLALPLSVETWSSFETGQEVILPLDYSEGKLDESGFTNETHVLCTVSRRTVEGLCRNELQALLRPIREVAIMAGALLPGDASPASVEAAMEMEEEYNNALEESAAFADFYAEDEEEGKVASSAGSKDDEVLDADVLLQLQEMDMKATKKAQQRGRTRAREVAKKERKYRQEKRKLETNNKPSKRQQQTDDTRRVKVRDGISGRPISRVVLVGGATRMPIIGRLIAALTGVVPQRTVNPDEAVALGCAVHVGVLDGMEGMGTVLNPMQAAILKAVAEQQQGMLGGDDDDEDFDEIGFF